MTIRIPNETYKNQHRIGRALYARGPMRSAKLALLLQMKLHVVEQVIEQMILMDLADRDDDGLVDICDALHVYYGDAPALEEQEAPGASVVTGSIAAPRMAWPFRALSAKHIPSTRGTRMDAPHREVPHFVTLAGSSVQYNNFDRA